MGLRFGGRTASSRGVTATNRGELHYTRGRHAGDMPTQRFAWRKIPHRSEPEVRRVAYKA